LNIEKEREIERKKESEGGEWMGCSDKEIMNGLLQLVYFGGRAFSIRVVQPDVTNGLLGKKSRYV
jgi:hypothetical protein